MFSQKSRLFSCNAFLLSCLSGSKIDFSFNWYILNVIYTFGKRTYQDHFENAIEILIPSFRCYANWIEIQRIPSNFHFCGKWEMQLLKNRFLLQGKANLGTLISYIRKGKLESWQHLFNLDFYGKRKIKLSIFTL